jgi:hypothetical protein
MVGGRTAWEGGALTAQLFQVELAREGKAMNMQLIHTINLGAEIPQGWEGYSYVQMLGAIEGEVARQLNPFLAAGLQPDISTSLEDTIQIYD